MFPAVPSPVRFPELETEILEFWRQRKIYEKSLAQRDGCAPFVFYEGPPTANGLPHPGHCLTRAIKDLFPRYRTMRGYLCERKAGWDTHGLPVEVEVCKELGIHSKDEIETYGVEPFIHRCQESVWRYMQQWERLTERLGFWIHLDEAYVTYHQSYVESVWWCLKNLFERGLLYQGHKIVWWWAQGGTALSAGEVGQGYREVADPSVYVRFPLVSDDGQVSDTSLLVWTTTPWTLPSNQFAAVHPELRYATVRDCVAGVRLIVAAALVDSLAEKVHRELVVEDSCDGRELVGRRYLPPFDFYHATQGNVQGRLRAGGQEHVAWRIVPADFVTIDSGTGVVHQAPAFGEVDFALLLAEQARYLEGQGPELICAVAPDGKFTGEAGPYAGRWVKEAERDIARELRHRGLLYHQEQYVHDYPFCWRAEEDPLIQYPRQSWFLRTSQFKEAMLANNQLINWLPPHIQTGRFGNFLESNVDWALSRERYWGTPLPIWVCDQSGQKEAMASYEELLAKPGVSGTETWLTAKRLRPELPDDLKVHKPYIDAITYASPYVPGARMRRVPDVIDCWFDSGAMPFAQWGYPQQGRAFTGHFPADFISEAIDQTRGWFYSLLAISTLMFSDRPSSDRDAPACAYPHPYRTCIVLGLMLAEWWESQDGKRRFLTEEDARDACGTAYTHRVGKMSKQLRNYRSPQEIFDTYGADALRWYFFANQPPWNSIIYSEKAIRESIPEFQLRLWNVYSFFVIYANIDGFAPAERINGDAEQLDGRVLARGRGYRPRAARSELDRWVLSELQRAAATVVQRMDAYDSYAACGELLAFVDGLSNWYVRRSRNRFWSGTPESDDKLDAYWTLYECLLVTCKLIAPFVPFLAEHLWQGLTAGFGGRTAESVHLCDYPTGQAAALDPQLSEQMQLAREISSLGRSARMSAKLKVRQPLAKVEVILADDRHRDWLEAHGELIRDELNVKQVEFAQHAEQYIRYQVLPNFRQLGPRLGKQLPAVQQALKQADGGKLFTELTSQGRIVLSLPGGSVELDGDDVEIRLQAQEGWTAAQGPHCVVVLSTELTDELVREGLARDVVRLVQERRKALACHYSDRIRLAIVTRAEELRQALEENREYVMGETLAVELRLDPAPGGDYVEEEVGEFRVGIDVQVARP